MSAPKPTMALATFAANFDAANLPADVRRKLGWLLLDYLRVCSIGARLPWSDWSRRYVGLVGRPGTSHVLFSPDIVNPQHATFLNVTFGSSFDADDTHVGAMLHPGVATWAAALAVAEHTGGSGPEVLAAVVAGYEVTIRIGLAVQPGHFKRGFQSTGTCDGFGTAAAAGRLLFSGTDARQKIADALGLAGGYASGLAQFYYSGGSAKRIHAAHAAEGGVSAALLAAEGYSGPNDIIEGQGGFARAYAGDWNPTLIEEGLDKGEIDYSVDLELNLADVQPGVAGPKRPQDRINLPELGGAFRTLLQKPVTDGGYGKQSGDLGAKYPVQLNGSPPTDGDMPSTDKSQSRNGSGRRT